MGLVSILGKIIVPSLVSYKSWNVANPELEFVTEIVSFPQIRSGFTQSSESSMNNVRELYFHISTVSLGFKLKYIDARLSLLLRYDRVCGVSYRTRSGQLQSV